MKPPIIKNLQDKLNELMSKDDKSCITAKDAADFLGVDVDAIRAAAENGHCPFAISGRTYSRGSRFTKIPKLAFYNWLNKTNE